MSTNLKVNDYELLKSAESLASCVDNLATIASSCVLCLQNVKGSAIEGEKINSSIDAYCEAISNAATAFRKAYAPLGATVVDFVDEIEAISHTSIF